MLFIHLNLAFVGQSVFSKCGGFQFNLSSTLQQGKFFKILVAVHKLRSQKSSIEVYTFLRVG